MGSQQVPEPSLQPAPPVTWRCCYDQQGNMHIWPEVAQQQNTSARCCFDAEGNIHVWPDAAQQPQCAPSHTQEGGMIDIHPPAAACNMSVAPWPESPQGPQSISRPNPEGGSIDLRPAVAPNMPGQYSSCRNPRDHLRSDSMGSWGSSTTAQSVASHNSYADSLRSESMHSWMSSPSSSSACNTPHVVAPPMPVVPEATHPKQSLLHLFKEKLKPKSKAGH